MARWLSVLSMLLGIKGIFGKQKEASTLNVGCTEAGLDAGRDFYESLRLVLKTMQDCGFNNQYGMKRKKSEWILWLLPLTRPSSIQSCLSLASNTDTFGREGKIRTYVTLWQQTLVIIMAFFSFLSMRTIQCIQAKITPVSIMTDYEPILP